MTLGPDLIPIGAVRFATAFDLWWLAVRPSDTEALALRRSDLAEAKLNPDPEAANAAAQALEALNLASDGGKASFAAAAIMVAREGAKAAFVGILARGDLAARVLDGGHELAIVPTWWQSTTFDRAARLTPAIYFDGCEFAEWLSAAKERAAPAFADLVRFFRDRLPPEPLSPRGRTADIDAARTRFGDVSAATIREARQVAYGARMPKRGRPTT